MLIRVAASLDQFPRHAVPILTTTVVECCRAGLAAASAEHAAALMRPENRDAVNPAYARTIEGAARNNERWVCQ